MMKKTIALALALGAGAVFAEFQAGFARVDATPPLGIPLVGYFSHRVSDGVLDPLYIDCVAVSDSTNKALIYCVDDLHLTNPFMEKAFESITKATGIPRERIYVHATHIHTGRADWNFSTAKSGTRQSAAHAATVANDILFIVAYYIIRHRLQRKRAFTL